MDLCYIAVGFQEGFKSHTHDQSKAKGRISQKALCNILGAKEMQLMKCFNFTTKSETSSVITVSLNL